MALVVGATLIGPSLVIVLADTSERATFSVIIGFTVALGLGLLLFPDVKNFQALLATAG